MNRLNPVKIRKDVDWQQFLGKQDLVWESFPMEWKNAAFIGNGLLGATIYKDRLRKKNLRWDIGRSDVTDHRENEPVNEGKARLPIGKLELETEGDILQAEMRLVLWNAEARVKVETTQGVIELHSYVHADKNIVVIESVASEGEEQCFWQWYPGISVSPRKLQYGEPFKGGINPLPTEEKAGDMNVCVQPLLVGGGYTTAWQEMQVSRERKVVFLSVGNTRDTGMGNQEAMDSISEALQIPEERLRETHRQWWHAFYAGNSETTGSFFSIPDARLENFYWIQLYKLASATRADRPAIDLMGPWFYNNTPWPAIWWNLNIQLTYWPVYASNHLELGESLCRMLDNNVDNLILNVREEYREDSAAVGRVTSYDCRSSVGQEICNLPWTCHNYWLQYRYSMDEEMLRHRLYPLLRRSINYYMHLLTEGDDGKLHLPVAISPEYPDMAPDANVDLSLLRWGCQTLLDICGKLNIEDPLKPRWSEILNKLVDYPVNENGLMIGTGVPFEKSHRHYSHLLMIYPLSIMNWEQAENRELIEKSLNHWMGVKGAHRGYSYTGASAISSRMGRGNDALDYLNRLMEQKDYPITQNTMYLEAGPVIETPLSGASSLHEMLLQSWGDKIRVFPAVPDEWKEAAFDNLRTEGAFLVGAVRKAGKTQFIKITSLAGEPCRIKADLESPTAVSSTGKVSITRVEEGVYDVDLKKGETALLFAEDTNPDFAIEPVSVQNGRNNYFGTRK